MLERTIPVYEVLNQEGLELIHEASLAILEEIGIEFRDAEAVADVARRRRGGRALPRADPARSC